MREYEKPLVDVVNEAAEGVYTASGNPGCDSKYMNGVWQHQYNGNWDGSEGMKAIFGCLGCPAYTETACGLLTHYEDSNKAASYDVNSGRNMPAWEYHGKGENDIVTSADVHAHGNQ